MKSFDEITLLLSEEGATTPTTIVYLRQIIPIHLDYTVKSLVCEVDAEVTLNMHRAAVYENGLGFYALYAVVPTKYIELTYVIDKGTELSKKYL